MNIINFIKNICKWNGINFETLDKEENEYIIKIICYGIDKMFPFSAVQIGLLMGINKTNVLKYIESIKSIPGKKKSEINKMIFNCYEIANNENVMMFYKNMANKGYALAKYLYASTLWNKRKVDNCDNEAIKEYNESLGLGNYNSAIRLIEIYKEKKEMLLVDYYYDLLAKRHKVSKTSLMDKKVEKLSNNEIEIERTEGMLKEIKNAEISCMLNHIGINSEYNYINNCILIIRGIDLYTKEIMHNDCLLFLKDDMDYYTITLIPSRDKKHILITLKKIKEDSLMEYVLDIDSFNIKEKGEDYA